MIDWTGRRALVTGAGSGIGRALCVALAARGAVIVAADIDGAGAAATATMTGGTGVAVDLAEPGAAAELIAAATAAAPLDLVVSNAGVGRNKRLLKEDFDSDTVARLFEINLFAALRLAQAYAAHLDARGGRGRLMITGSENSLSVPDAVRGAGLGLYAATKHGVLIAAEWLRDEIAGAGKLLDLHVLLPGAVLTGLTAHQLPANPADWPPALGVITAERCAEIALAGIDAGLFYIPTHAHLATDMRPRLAGIEASVAALGLA